MDLAGATALVTGAASGLGAATAQALTAAGVVVVGLDLPAAWPRAERPSYRPFPGDVRSEADVEAAVDAATSAGPLRLAVNCAGIGTAGRVLSRRGVHDLATFERVIGINLVGTFNVVRLAAAAMAGSEPLVDGVRGLIVNTASVAAFDGQVGQAAYAASKGGVAAMTLPLARDLASVGVRVMTIAPGILDTPMMAGVTEEFRTALAGNVPLPARFGRPEEYARLVLAISAQDYLNGEVIRLDGALRMPPR